MSIPIAEKEIVVLSNMDFESAEMGIAEEDVPTIIAILRDKLYRNKERAIVREYSTNARDAMIECDNGSNPFEVWLPTRLDPVFKVRDYGTGLSETAINQIFRFLGKSTKRDSNLVNGQLGIGAKSGLALANQFNVTSYVDGQVTFYVVLNDPSRKGRIDKIAGPLPTDEPNGVLIEVPIPAASIEKMHQEASFVYKYFDLKPTIHGLDESKYPLTRPKPVLEGKTWRIVGGESVAIMGNVAYPIGSDFIVPEVHGEEGEKWKQFLSAGVEIDFPIGSIEFAPSREELSYNEHTINVLIDTIKSAIKEAADLITDKLKNAPNRWEAMCLVSALQGELGEFGRNLKSVIGKIQWQGKEVGNTIHVGYNHNAATSGWMVREYQNNTYTNRFSHTGNPSSLYASHKTLLIEIDDKNGKAQPAKMKYYCEQNGYERVYLLSFTSATARQLFYKSHLEDIPVMMQTALPKAPPSSSGSGGSGPVNPKHSLQVFTFNYSTSSTASESWEQETVDAVNGKGYYVVIDRFNVQKEHGTELYPKDYLDTLEFAHKLLGFNWKKETIIGVKRSFFDNKKLGKNWKPLFEYLRDAAKKVLEKQKQFQVAIDYSEYMTHRAQTFECFQKELVNLQYPDEAMGTYLAAAQEAYFRHDKVTKGKLNEAKTLFDKIGYPLHYTYTPTYLFSDGAEKITESYPLMGVVGTGYYSHGYAQNVEKFIHYINLCDAETVSKRL